MKGEGEACHGKVMGGRKMGEGLNGRGKKEGIV